MGVAEPGTLFLIPVHFLDGVVDIDQGVVIDASHDWRDRGDVIQPSAGYGVELSDMSEGEGTQK